MYNTKCLAKITQEKSNRNKYFKENESQIYSCRALKGFYALVAKTREKVLF